MSGYQEKPVELPWPYSPQDLDPEPVEGCERCAVLAEERQQERDQGQFGRAVIAGMKIAEHRRWGSHNDAPETAETPEIPESPG
ncbi:hypothetical protein SSP35_08_02150 [Streptomyces sp. NBRC 110611]|uniref:hypothetical protein n=1 Tax=Streptomyces sp. NBRC 110611 TaxID=1621259 RepID=UPI00082BAADF|nr:hypothetical protein [Streptomyces sp. NBRC 110611]GAU68721.1 hypothetical protein SSP35_08_02150 [Streptomyces sp. NBRC 110611]